MKDWKALAQARDLGIPPADIDRVVAPLEALEETFRPLAASLMPEHEPCTIFPADEPVSGAGTEVPSSGRAKRSIRRNREAAE